MTDTIACKLISLMADELESYRTGHRLAVEARAYLAETQKEEMTNDELQDLWRRAVLARWDPALPLPTTTETTDD